MALNKLGYKGANQGTTKIPVAINESGYIAQSGQTAASTKNISINKVAAENSKMDNNAVASFFIGMIGGRFDTNNTMSVTWESDPLVNE